MLQRRKSLPIQIQRNIIPSILDEIMEMPSYFEQQMMQMNTDIDMYEEGDKLVVKTQIPGFQEKDIEVAVDDNILTIRGEVESEKKEEKERKYYLREIQRASFQRSIQLPVGVSLDSAKAEYRDGVVSVSFSKSEVQSKRILPFN
jgi:HSP20 family protein